MSEPTKSVAVTKATEILEKAKFVMTPEEHAQYTKLMQRFERAKAIKNAPYKYYDGMDYVSDYASNEDLKNNYLTPKSNDTEVRVNTGTAEKKLDAVKNELMSMFIKHEIKAHDESDLEISNLGDDMTDIVTRTNRMEKEDDMWEEMVDELLSQRVVYVKETYQTINVFNNKQTIEIAKKELVSGLKVFPGSWTIPAYLWDTQPYVFEYDRVSYEQAKAILGHLPNFKHVKPNQNERREYLGGAFSYQFGELQDGEVELMTYYSVPDNEYQIWAGSVPMYSPAEPLPHSYTKYCIRAFTVKSMSRNFLAGRPLTAMAKTVQGISNEMLRLFIRKTQQSLEPPMATKKGGKIYSHAIFNPSAWTQGLGKDDYSKLIDHQGVTQGEMAMYDKIDQEVEKFVGTPNIAQGMQGSREMSATEVMTITKQFLKQLGYIVAALMRVRRDMTELRIYTIFDNYLDPIKKQVNPLTNKIEDIYRSFTIENSVFPDNRKGKKIIKIIDRDLDPEEQKQLYDFEEEKAKEGKNVRLRFINKNALKNIPIFWYISTSIQDKEGTALDKLTFQDQLNQGLLISKALQKPLNGDIVTEEFERKWKAKDWFNAPPPDLMQEGQMQPVDSEQTKMQAGDLLKDISKAKGTMGQQISEGARNAESSAVSQVSAQEAMMA